MAAKVISVLTLALAVIASPTSLQSAASNSEPATSPRPVERRQDAASGGKAPKASGGKSGGGLSALGSLGGSLSMGSSSDMKGAYTCKYAAFMCARGTGEPGNMGFVACPPLGTALRKTYGQDILIQGIDYSTNFAGGGAKEFVRLTKDLMQKCPSTKIVWSGYSQGAMQVHEGLGQLGNDAGKVHAAVTFGDPYSTAGWTLPFAGLMGGGGMSGAGGKGKTGGGKTPKGGASDAKKSDAGRTILDTFDALDEPESDAPAPAAAKGSKGAKAPKAETAKQAPAAPAKAAKSSGSVASSGAAEVGPGPFNAKNGLIICSTGDFVCGLVPGGGGGKAKGGNGVVSGGSGAGHLSYISDGSIPKAHDFIVEKIGRSKKV